ncbi:MAG TPA: GNAT family N-acetyltransferase [Steroidobacteraceae bacterium]|nr:GNAT family N-acetyltransferase [Steroidobacteraceae bacterium]
MDVDIRNVDPQGIDALGLLREASIDARALYPEAFGDTTVDATNGPLVKGGVYVVAYAGDVPVACGALRPWGPEVAEVRRMYVHREHRRLGLGRRILDHLVDAATRMGYSRLVLETGCRQRAAMRLYESRGFGRIDPFGEYVNDPTSVCYARDIGRQQAAGVPR